MKIKKKYLLIVFILLVVYVISIVFSFVCSRLWCKDYYDLDKVYVEDVYSFDQVVFIGYNCVTESLFFSNGVDIINDADDYIDISFVRSNVEYPSRVQVSYITLADLLIKYDFGIEKFDSYNQDPSFVFFIEIKNPSKKDVYVVGKEGGRKLIWSEI